MILIENFLTLFLGSEIYFCIDFDFYIISFLDDFFNFVFNFFDFFWVNE